MAECIVKAVWIDPARKETPLRTITREIPLSLYGREGEFPSGLILYSESPPSGGISGLPGVGFESLSRLADPLGDDPGREIQKVPFGENEENDPERLADAFTRECARVLETLAGRPAGWLILVSRLLNGPGGDGTLASLTRILAGRRAAENGVPEMLTPSVDWFPLAGRVEPPEKREPKEETEVLSPLDAQALEALLSEGGPLSSLLPGFEPRRGQQDMLRAVTEAFNSGKHLLVEAGTGIGKSLAYLLPALAWTRATRAPVVVSTNTRNLQSQLFEKDLPVLREIFGEDLKIALIKGRSNYLCFRRLLFLCETFSDEIEPRERPMLAHVLAWAAITASGDLDELIACLPECAPLARSLSSSADECPGKACRHYRRCILWRTRNFSQNADLVVANHSLVFAEMARDPIGLPPFKHLVLDEAHNLEEAATRHFAVEVSWMRAHMMLRRIWRGSRRKQTHGILATIRRQIDKGVLGNEAAREASLTACREARLATEDNREEAELFFGRLNEFLPRETSDPLRYGAGDFENPPWPDFLASAAPFVLTLSKLEASLETLASAMEKAGAGELRLSADMVYDTRAAAKAARAFQDDLKFLLSAESDAHVYWIEKRKSRSKAASSALVAAPLEIGEALARDLYDPLRTIVFCSATLSVNGSFAFMSERLGLNRIDPERLTSCEAPSPFDFSRQVLVQSPMFLPEPGNSAGSTYAEDLADLLVEVFRRTRGRALGLFTSYAMLRRCAMRLTGPLDALGIRVLVQEAEGSRERLTRIFRTGGCVLLGTHSFWEGIDVVGEALSCVVVARLPFPAVGDPLVSARCERLAAQGIDPFRGYMLPRAVIRFRQGFGRLIRHRGDSGVVIVADRRLWTRPYGVWFRRDLPCPIKRRETRETLLQELEAKLAPSEPG